VVAWPRGFHQPAGSLPALGGRSRRILVPDGSLYTRPVTVDLGNDGMAPEAIFSGAGTAQAFCGPAASSETWSLDQCYVSTSVGQLDAAQCTVYVAPLVVAQYAVTGSLAGGGSQFGLGGLACPNGWYVWAVWSGGLAGAVGYLRVTGVKTALTA
jgi:hypothetical protein